MAAIVAITLAKTRTTEKARHDAGDGTRGQSDSCLKPGRCCLPSPAINQLCAGTHYGFGPIFRDCTIIGTRSPRGRFLTESDAQGASVAIVRPGAPLTLQDLLITGARQY